MPGDLPKVVVYGSAGHCLAVTLQMVADRLHTPVFDVVAFIDDYAGGQGAVVAGRPVLSLDEWREGYLAYPCLFPIGGGGDRRTMVARIAALGGTSIALYDESMLPPLVTVGTGSLIVGPGGIGTNVTIGDHSQILSGHTIGHDVVIGDYVTLAPSCAVSGYVIVEDGAFIGVNATISNGRRGHPIVIGAGATVAAGAVVMKSVPAGGTVVGNPARSLRDLARRRRAARS